MTSTPSKLSIPAVFSRITAPWQPKMVACVNSTTEIRIAKIQGKFIWHAHPDTDELFYIVDGGPLTLNYRERNDDESSEKKVVLVKGEMWVVPKGVQHLPEAEEEASVMMIEQAGTVNTGNREESDRTATIEDVRS
ncbi:uncharacterized protein BDZ99DRAFT_465185 [Mytilinidion resinicola]|uniref:Cupin type-1 domain-containing protein n=1 Tax=Mytilinidion resinicola TaxID=574789 RepID=A0A6A6YEP9_9PEZI|nr:uncharacterized protein BDZ99DRAFT_465185 [Mytilinidion resinicola]KAF2807271.1 hypothetical protein BDZ99DRAFT_465185 [Mytilinidion resinicola]